MGSIRTGSFLVFSERRILNSIGTCKFFIWFCIGYFRAGSDSDFRVQVKCLSLVVR